MNDAFGVSLGSKGRQNVSGQFYPVVTGHAARPHDEVADFRHDPVSNPITIPGYGTYAMPEGSGPLKPNKGGVISAMGVRLVAAWENGADPSNGSADVHIRKAPKLSRLIGKIFKYDAAPQITWYIPSLKNPEQ